jgi:hypothetical protein
MEIRAGLKTLARRSPNAASTAEQQLKEIARINELLNVLDLCWTATRAA